MPSGGSAGVRRLGFVTGLWSLPVYLLRGESRGRFRQKLALFPNDGRYSRLSHRLFATGGRLCAGFVAVLRLRSGFAAYAGLFSRFSRLFCCATSLRCSFSSVTFSSRCLFMEENDDDDDDQFIKA